MLLLGVVLGLFFGKLFGIFSFSWVVVKFGVVKLLEGINFKYIFVVLVLCGIGFIMLIFILLLVFG